MSPLSVFSSEASAVTVIIPQRHERASGCCRGKRNQGNVFLQDLPRAKLEIFINVISQALRRTGQLVFACRQIRDRVVSGAR